MPQFKDVDIDLLLAFLIRETADFGGKINKVKAKKLLAKITKEVATYPLAINLKINSLGNAGCIIRSLSLDLLGEGWEVNNNQNLEINLCTCGNLDCWGHIRVAK